MEKAAALAAILLSISLLVGASGAFLAFSVQNSVAQIKSQVQGVNDNINLLYDALNIPGVEQAKLIAEARKEGTLTVYTVVPTDLMLLMEKAFESRYPGIDLQFWRGTGEAVGERLTAEQGAGKFLADVAWIGEPTNTWTAAQRGFFQEYVPLAAKRAPGIQPAYLERKVSISQFLLIVFAYNTKLVKPDQLPSMAEMLTDPKWKKKIVFDDAETPLLIYLLETRGRDEAIKFLKALSAQVLWKTGHTTVSRTVESGEAAIGFSYVHHPISFKALRGSPIDWYVPKDFIAIGTPFHIGLLKNAPHSNAARLFIEWALSEEGQSVIANQAYYPTANSAAWPDSLKRLQQDNRIWLFTVETVKKYNLAEIEKLWKEATGL